MSDEHEAFIKTPQQLITVVVLAFVVPILVIVLLVKYVGSSTRTGAGADSTTAEAVEARNGSWTGRFPATIPREGEHDGCRDAP